MKVIGLTGGIGSGKTTVAQMFANLGVPIFIADVEAKTLMVTSKVVRRKLLKAFGEDTYQNGELNRPYLAKLVFNDKKLLETLNGIVHPKVHQRFNRWLTKQTTSYVIYEAAIIFELGREHEFYKTILVVADADVKMERLMARDKSSKAQIESRVKNQWLDEVKVPLADYIIHNKALKETLKQVADIHANLQ